MIIMLIIILLLRTIFHINKIMLLGKAFSFTPDEANVDDLVKAYA